MQGKVSLKKKKILVVSKHKKWLAELQKEKEKLDMKEQEEKLIKDAKLRKVSILRTF
jgi:hypothetical protein